LTTAGYTSSAPETPVVQPSDPDPPQEVFLSFNYRNLFEKVVIAYYDDGNYYLPVSELFTTLKIGHTVDNSSLSINGFYLDPDNEFRFDFAGNEVRLKDRGVFTFEPTQMLVKELDYYVQLEVFAEVFDLNFTVDKSNLLLQLETPHTLPIMEQYNRGRERAQKEKATIKKEFYPLVFDRNRDMIGGAFFDYSFTSIIDQDQNLYTYNFDLGAEVAGGDLQGSAYGNFRDGFSNFSTNDLRWRYVMRNNEYLTQIYAGQTRSDGLINRGYTGIRLTNEPIEPRYQYDSYEIEGTAPIGSEVELYYNNALYDYTRLTEDEQYRFLAPLTYGTSRLRVRIYGPDGQMREREEVLQIPFNFLPEGELSYNINAGKLNNPIIGDTKESYIAQGNVAYGISSWLTQKVGVEYFDEYTDQTPLFYSSSSARIFDDYLVNLDIAPNALYRVSSNVIYPSSASWGFDYTYYSQKGVYNPVGDNQEWSANVFLPFRLKKQPFNFRLSTGYSTNPFGDYINYALDLNSRMNRLNLRLRYRDRQFDEFSYAPSNSADLSLSASYLLSQRPNVPRYLHNTFISGNLTYNPGLNQFQEVVVQASKSIFGNGRIQASFQHNFVGNFNSIDVGVTIDFSALRSRSTARTVDGNQSFTQNIRGSIGYDDHNNDVAFSNRDQVGRSATSLRLYVDSNNSGSYDEDDKVIDEEAVRIGRAGSMSSTKEGLLRFSQLQSYHRINMEINQAKIKNPMLVPELEKFSFVTDPNQYKPINIPFYTSGVVSGKVVKQSGDKKEPQSGLRVYLKSKNGDFEKEMRTFNDGAFYSYKIPPGSYHLFIDRNQLEFLSVSSEPDSMDVTVEALAEGDFVEGLNFTLKPKTTTAERTVADTASAKPADDADTTYISDQELYYKIQLASFRTFSKAKEVAMEAASRLNGSFGVIFNTKTDLYAIRSLPITNRDQAIENILSYHNNEFSSAALLVMNSKDIKPGALQSDFIKLREFRSEEAANRFAKQAETDLDLTAAVSFNETDDTYLVYVDERYYSKADLQSELSAIQDQPSYKGASLENIQAYSLFVGEIQQRAMNLSFQIRIENSTADVDEELLTSLIDPESRAVLKKSSDGTFFFDGLTSWTRTKELHQKLASLAAIEDQIAVLFEK
jgi:hypothetical protein